MDWFVAASCRESDPDCGQQEAEPGQQAAEVVAGGGEHGVDRIAGLPGKAIAVHSVVGFGVASARRARC